MKKHIKKVGDRLTYAYIRRIKKWMFCPACQSGKTTIDKASTKWTCEKCGYQLSADEFEDDYVFWFCDECGAFLNNQEGFDKNAQKHICTECGYENDTTFENVKGICSDCGKVIPDPEQMLCADCRIARRQKAKERLQTVGKAVGIAAAVAGTVYLAAQASDEDEYSFFPDEDSDGDSEMRCANCGNTDENTLWDEGDTVYCSKCCHRTRKNDGEDDLVECPYCHRMRDRKAFYCRWCNDSTWIPSSDEEFEEIDKILKDMGY